MHKFWEDKGRKEKKYRQFFSRFNWGIGYMLFMFFFCVGIKMISFSFIGKNIEIISHTSLRVFLEKKKFGRRKKSAIFTKLNPIYLYTYVFSCWCFMCIVVNIDLYTNICISLPHYVLTDENREKHHTPKPTLYMALHQHNNVWERKKRCAIIYPLSSS